MAFGNGAGGVKTGHSARVSDCTIALSQSPGAIGLEMAEDCIAQRCIVRSNNVGVVGGDACSLDRLTITMNSSDGASVGKGSIVTETITRSNGGNGIETRGASIVRNSTAVANGSVGILAGIALGDRACAVIGSVAEGNPEAGIWADEGAVIVNSAVAANGASPMATLGHGIRAEDGSVVKTCAAFRNSGSGVYVRNGCRVADVASSETGGGGLGFDIENHSSVQGGVAYNNDHTGIRARFNGASVLESVCGQNEDQGLHLGSFGLSMSNVLTDNTNGLRIDFGGTGNMIHLNTASLNGDGYDIQGEKNLIVNNKATDNSQMAFNVVGGTPPVNQIATVSLYPTFASHWDNFEGP